MEKIWKVKPAADVEVVENLCAAINVNKTIGNILVDRGVDTFEKAKKFFRPQIDDLHDPFLMMDMDEAVERLMFAKEKNQHILIYGDYDVDGTTSVTLVYSFLRDLGLSVSYYIPDRYEEGYGISFQGIDFARDNDISLIIALDCGIKAIDKVEYANEKGIDFIICDHHRPGEKLPPAIAVLDPKRHDCEYPYKELCGCGVGFKFMQAYCQKEKIDMEHLFSFIDLAAIAIGADIVPITGENRVLCYFGLQLINDKPRIGIQQLLDVAQIKKQLTITDLVFIIAPRINAAGRIDSGNRAVELLSSIDDNQSMDMVERINQYNSTRKGLDKEITEHALMMMEEDPWYADANSTVVHHEGWHKGVVGIVASRLIERHYKPTIVLTESEGKLTGSARSVKHFDVYNAIDSCSDLLENFGGHKYAAGLTMKKENIDHFKLRFEDYVIANMKEEWQKPEILIDEMLKLNQINKRFFGILKQIGPFGPRNMKPVFVSYNCLCKGQSRLLKDSHLKINIFQEEDSNTYISGIGFNMPEHLDLVLSGKPFDVVYTIEENHWNETITLQLMIKDIKTSNLQ